MLKGKFIKKEVKKQTGVFFGKGEKSSITWNISTGLAQVYALRFKYMNATGKPMKVRMQFIDSKGVVLKEDHLTFAETPGKWRMLSTTTVRISMQAIIRWCFPLRIWRGWHWMRWMCNRRNGFCK